MSKTCGCCDGTLVLTPAPIVNRPGLTALAYRSGTFAEFFETMKARLSSADYPALADLSTREANDPSIALLDAWAVVADVLTFYQERIANEGYLRTATERLSVVELARLIAYTPRPGVASSVHLAYTLDKPQEVTERDSEVTIAPGSRAQSVPGPGEQAQTFETADPLEARSVWNNLRPRLKQPQLLQADSSVIYLDGVVTNLKPNDALLLVFASVPALRRVLTVEAQFPDSRTKVTLQPLTSTPPAPAVAAVAVLPRLSTLDTSLALVGPLSKAPAKHPANSLALTRDLAKAFASTADTNPLLLSTINPAVSTQIYSALKNAAVTPATPVQVFALRAAPSPFGHNAPLKPILDDKGIVKGAEEWTFAGFVSIQIILAFQRAGRLALGAVAIDSPPRNENFNEVFIKIHDGEKIGIRVLKIPFQSSSFDVGPWKVTARSAASENATNFDFKFSLAPAREIRLEVSSGQAQVDVTLDGAASKVTAPFGSAINQSNNGRKTDIDFTTGVFSITDEAPRPPDPLVLALDTTYDKITPGSWVVIERDSSNRAITTVDTVQQISKAAYGMTAKVTQLKLKDPWLHETVDPRDMLLSVARGMAILAQSEELKLAQEPVLKPMCGTRIELDGLYAGLQSGRWLIVSGTRSDVPGTSGVAATELVMLAGVEQNLQALGDRMPDKGPDPTPVPGDSVHSFLILASPLAYCYQTDSVKIFGNVVRATHGETRSQVLGSGDASQRLQRFALKQSPLTFVSASTVSGAASTLAVRVNDVLWREAASMTTLGPNDRAFVTSTSDDATTSVIFGNGAQGARLPTGVENVTAVYRTGIGSGGNVAAQQISLLATRPLGVKEVINPQPATGGANAETRDQARVNAPLAVMALDRLVAVRDYADFARTFAGIGKASAVEISDGRRQIVHLTIAGAGDIPLAEDSDLFRNLSLALGQFGDPNQPMRVATRELLAVVVSANVRVVPDYQFITVAPSIRTALLDAFSFERRDLGQDVLLSQVISVIQSVPGVSYVDVDTLDRIGESSIADDLKRLQDSPRLNDRIEAKLARTGDDPLQILPAQLAYLSPDITDALILKEITQ
jgi:hypothetical protein